MAFYIFLLGSLVLAIWVSLDARATYTSISLSCMALLWIWLKSPLIIDIDSELRVGPAHLELRYIEKVEVLDSESMRLQRTRFANPAAFLALRFWCSTGVKITLNDKRDPTPYWLVSSRKPEKLKAALEN